MEKAASLSIHFPGVSKCYIFKSQLQEYTQRVGILMPVYETVMEGSPRDPCFKSTVIVNNIRYDSLPGFPNRKAAEQSAAEIAFKELAKSGNKNESITAPLPESGLCKHLLQQYARKMNYALPSYCCQHDITPGKLPFTCTVYVGGTQYTGAAATSKKAAEVNAAKIALLAVQSITEGSPRDPCFKSTVIVNNIRYDSLPGFPNRKAAEQSAAEIAFKELAKSGNKNESITAPLPESGLCKHLLQQYARKMNYALPSYCCQHDITPGKLPVDEESL